MSNIPINVEKCRDDLGETAFEKLSNQFKIEVQRLNQRCAFESDMAVILLGSILVEDILRNHVTRLFARVSVDQKDFHDDLKSPLSWFRNIMLMAFKTYMIDEDAYRAITKLQSIRNKVAHNIEPDWEKDVDALAVSLDIRNLSLPDDVLASNTAVVEYVDDSVAEAKLLDSEARRLYIMSVAWLLTALTAHLESKVQLIPVTQAQCDRYLDSFPET